MHQGHHKTGYLNGLRGRLVIRHPHRHRTRHGRRSLRHDWVLRRSDGPGRDRRGHTRQDGPCVSTETAVERSRSNDHEDKEDRPSSVAERERLSSASPGGECLLSVQIDHRGWSARLLSRRASDRSRDRVQRSESDDRAWSAGVVQRWSVSCLWVGTAAGQFRVMHQRPSPALVDSDIYLRGHRYLYAISEQ